MKLLLDGRLDQSLQMKDLLSGIAQAEAPGLTVLKFAVNKEERGEIYFLGGHYIVSAQLSATTIVGKAALDELLKVREADFTYYACDSVDALPQSDNFRINLKELIDGWQQAVPASGDQLLDKIFNVPSVGENAHPQSVSESKQADLTADSVAENDIDVHQSEGAAKPAVRAGLVGSSGEDIDWDLVQPLISKGAPGSGTDSSDWAFDEDAHSAQGVRTLASGFHWQRALRQLFLLVVFLIVSVVVVGGFWLLINAPSAHFGTRRYAVPLEKIKQHKVP